MREGCVHREAEIQHSGTSEPWTYVGSEDNFVGPENRAVFFTGIEDMQKWVDDSNLAIEAEDTMVLVLKNVGPIGAQGTPEPGLKSTTHTTGTPK